MKKQPAKNESLQILELPSLSPGKGDFELQLWKKRPQTYRFVGWRDDYRAFYVLGEHDMQGVLSFNAIGHPDNRPLRLDVPPILLTETRLMPPPCRMTQSEADLLKGACGLFQKANSYPEIVKAYLAEAETRGIEHPRPPEQWELLQGEALAPSSKPPEGEWQNEESALLDRWGKERGITKESMNDERRTSTRRHGNAEMLWAQVRFRLECQEGFPVWLSSFRLSRLQSTNDIGQIKALLAERPDLCRITPEKAEEHLGISKGDPKHRTLKKYCRIEGLDFHELTGPDLNRLSRAQAHCKEDQGRSLRRIKNTF